MKIFLIPPPELPVPALRGGAVETLLTQLIAENEKDGALALFCASVADPAAQEQAAGYRHTKMFYLPAPPHRRRFYGPVCGMRRRLGLPAPLDPWYNAVAKAVAGAAPDLIIAEGGDPTELAAISAAAGREKCLLHLHGPTHATARMDALYGGALALSDYTRREFLADSALPPERVYPLPNCIDPALFCPANAAQRAETRARLGYAPEDFVVFFCGRMAPEKGIDQLVEALALCPDPSLKLLAAGSPFFAAQSESEYFSAVRQRADALGGRVRFTGFVPNTELAQYYGAADLACFPATWEEPAGLTGIEAMACGVPVLATRSGGMPEYLAGSGAVLVEKGPGLAARLAEQMTALKADPARRAEMQRRGLIRAGAFTAQTYYRNFVRIVQDYTAALQAPKPPQGENDVATKL